MKIEDNSLTTDNLNGVNVRDTELAACLFTLGFPCVDILRVSGDCEVMSWKFLPFSPDVSFSVEYVLKRWNDWAWLNDSRNAEPLAYIIASFHNRRRLLDMVKQRKSMVAIKQGNKQILIPEHASDAIQARAKQFLKGW